jgi:hypothetical protein
VTGQRIDAGDGIGAIVAAFLRSLIDQSAKCVGPATARLVDGAVSLITALVSERLDRTAPTAPHQAMALRVRDYIERRLFDPGLSPDVIAEAHGISPRYLFKLFAEEETSVAGWIRTQRLERCARDLADPEYRRQAPRAARRGGWPPSHGRSGH